MLSNEKTSGEVESSKLLPTGLVSVCDEGGMNAMRKSKQFKGVTKHGLMLTNQVSLIVHQLK